MSQRLDLSSAKIGDTFIQPFKFIDKDTGAAIPQAGHVYEFTLSLDPTKDRQEADSFQTITVADDAVAAEGIMSVRVEASETAGFTPAAYNYELKRIIAGATETVLTLFHGKIKFEF